MTLARADLLGLAPAAALLLVAALTIQWWRVRRLERLLGGTALRRLLPEGATKFPWKRLVCVFVAAGALAAAAAEPRPRAVEPPPPPAPLDIAIAVDVSLSMGADDERPTRLGRAQEIVAHLAGALPAARIGLVVFASWPYTLVPPTDDAGVVRYFADALRADLVVDRDQGTALATAIDQAREALAARPRDGARRVILVLSDGGAHDEPASAVEAARAAAREGIEVWAAGLGSTRGTELETETGPVVDESGATVFTRLDENLLIEVASVGGGSYTHVGEERGLRALSARLQDAEAAPPLEGRGPPDSTLLLALLGLAVILWEGALDGARSDRRAARTGEMW